MAAPWLTNPSRILRATRAWAKAEMKIQNSLPGSGGASCKCHNCKLLKEVALYESLIYRGGPRKKKNP